MARLGLELGLEAGVGLVAWTSARLRVVIGHANTADVRSPHRRVLHTVSQKSNHESPTHPSPLTRAQSQSIASSAANLTPGGPGSSGGGRNTHTLNNQAHDEALDLSESHASPISHNMDAKGAHEGGYM